MSLRQVTASCHCNPRRTTPYRPPLHMESSFSGWLTQIVTITPATVIGSWKCHRCGSVHPITAAQAGWCGTPATRTPVGVSPCATSG